MSCNQNAHPFKLCFTLKQHTPIIHFQSDQHGATLRASELKPKLDRFLIDKDIKGYKTGPQGEKFFDYKVKIICTGTKTEPIERQKLDKDKNLKVKKDGSKDMQSLPTFFANMGDEWAKNPKQLAWSASGDIKIEIFVKDGQLKNEIDRHFSNFISQTNFGMRQSKGFGSFTVENIAISNGYIAKFNIDLSSANFNIQLPNVEYMSSSSAEFKKYYPLFSILDLFYKTLRSGINQVNGSGNSIFYFKSLMFQYAKSEGMSWDKKAIKSKFLQNDDINKQAKYEQMSNYGKEVLTRDMLGLGAIAEYKRNDKYPSYGFTVRHPKTDAKHPDKLNNANIKPNDITRFKSPITFKIIEQSGKNFDIYIFAKDIPQAMLNKKFKILKANKDRVLDEVNITTPESFDISAYLNFALQSTSLDKSVEDKDGFRKHLNYKILKEIYRQFPPVNQSQKATR